MKDLDNLLLHFMMIE